MARIQKNDYDGMSWIDSIVHAVGKKKASYETDRASMEETKEVVENVMSQTCEAAFGTKPEDTTEQKIRQTAKTGMEEHAQIQNMAYCDAIRNKLKDRGIDPVALNVVSKKDWESNDPSLIEGIAKNSIIAASKVKDRSWETVAPAKHRSALDVDDKSGKVMSIGGREHYNDKPYNIPMNANSIFDPNRLDRMAAENNEHDRLIQENKKNKTDKQAERKESLKQTDIPNDFHGMSSSRIIPSASSEKEVFVQRVPKNQLSIMDNLEQHSSKKPEEMKEVMSDIFNRVEDQKTKTQKANVERKNKIRTEAEKDRSWEKNEKGISTSDLAKKLMSLWIPEKGE